MIQKLAFMGLFFYSLVYSQDLTQLFEKYNAKGSLVISSLDGAKNYIYNAPRAGKRMTPASTFKILNTLIALDENVIDEEKIFIWDKTDKGWRAWNKNQTLKAAFQISCVWCYQEIARKLNHNVYKKHMKNIDYGNAKTGPKLDTFWLNGRLKISSFEQIELLKKIYKNKLPYSKEHINVLKSMMQLKRTPVYEISGKTGWATSSSVPIGWFVGYIKTKDDVYFFATNLDSPTKKALRLRQIITMEAFKIKGIL